MASVINSSIGKKLWVALAGLLLASFLLVHMGINLLVLDFDNPMLYNKAAHFMSTNFLIKIVEIVLFGGLHLRRAVQRPNRNAVRAGAALFTTGILVLLSGVFLTRFGFFEVNDPAVRGVAYWIHIVAPFVAAWLFVLHRLAGPRLRWRFGLDDEDELTLKEIGDKYNLSRERIRQLQEQALGKLRRRLDDEDTR